MKPEETAKILLESLQRIANILERISKDVAYLVEREKEIEDRETERWNQRFS